MRPPSIWSGTLPVNRTGRRIDAVPLHCYQTVAPIAAFSEVRPRMTSHATARHNMVENQLRTNRITDERVLAAFAAVPRERFLPERFRDAAYADEDVAIGGGRFLIEPLALAKLVQSAVIEQHSVVLVLGDWTGYVGAITARLAGRVITLIQAGQDRAVAKTALAVAGASDVTLEPGDPTQGLPSHAPFDAIIVAGAVKEIPTALLDQLAEDARLVTVVGDSRVGQVTVFRKVGGGIGRTRPFDATVAPLPGFQGMPSFQF